jgi:3-oxoacyl-[acyl-carrier protein] reductase
MSRFADKVAVVTGGASGIGREIAKRLVGEGARVALGDRNGDLLTDAATELGDACVTSVCDVTVETDVEVLVATATAAFGRVDLGVNCAGIGSLSPIVQLRPEEWDAVLGVCLKGVFLATKHEATAMLRQGTTGVVLNIASINDRQPAEGLAAYCSAKAGVEMFTRVAALELGGAGIRVVGISPGFIDTPLTKPLGDTEAFRQGYLDNTPLGRTGTTTDIADAALFLLSDQGAWITGETLVVDGGQLTRAYPPLLQLAGWSPNAP